MGNNTLFISYGHRDMKPIDWLDRLSSYLAPLRHEELVDIWHDSRIPAGSDWRSEIRAAMDRATAALLLVGPRFLASEFIVSDELPVLLSAAKTRGIKIYPVVVGYCGYKRSILGKYQACNDPDRPLEALPTAEQNRILNEVSRVIDEDMRRHQAPAIPPQALALDTQQAMREIGRELETTWNAYVAQCRRRDRLVATLESRFGARGDLHYEDFLFQHYQQLTEEEKRQFDMIRAMTEGLLYKENEKILRVIEDHPQVLQEVPRLADLRQHLVFWLNKYEKVFTKRPEMCLVYVEPEDGVPFPAGVAEDLKEWMKVHH